MHCHVLFYDGCLSSAIPFQWLKDGLRDCRGEFLLCPACSESLQCPSLLRPAPILRKSRSSLTSARVMSKSRPGSTERMRPHPQCKNIIVLLVQCKMAFWGLPIDCVCIFQYDPDQPYQATAVGRSRCSETAQVVR